MCLDRLARRAGCGVGTELGSFMSVAERWTLNKPVSIMGDASQSMHSTVTRQRSVFSGKLFFLNVSI